MSQKFHHVGWLTEKKEISASQASRNLDLKDKQQTQYQRTLKSKWKMHRFY